MLSMELLMAMVPQPLVAVDGPDAPPISVTRGTYPPSKIKFTVVDGDSSASVRFYEDGVFQLQIDSSVWETGRSSVGLVSASHIKNGIETAKTVEGGV